MKALEWRHVEKRFKKRRGEGVRAPTSVSLSVGTGEVVGKREEHAGARHLHARPPGQGRGREVFGTGAASHRKQAKPKRRPDANRARDKRGRFDRDATGPTFCHGVVRRFVSPMSANVGHDDARSEI